MKKYFANVLLSVKKNVHNASFWVSVLSFIALAAEIIAQQFFGFSIDQKLNNNVAGAMQVVLIFLSSCGVVTNHNGNTPKDTTLQKNYDEAQKVLNELSTIIKDMKTAKPPVSNSNPVSSLIEEANKKTAESPVYTSQVLPSAQQPTVVFLPENK